MEINTISSDDARPERAPPPPPTAPFSPLVLTNVQIQGDADETTNTVGDCHVDVTEEDASRLQQAIEEMQRLDQMLAAATCREQHVKRQRKELRAQLWRHLLRNTAGHSPCAEEALNTRLFLALEAAPGTEEQDWVASVFDTQVTDCDEGNPHVEKSEKRPDKSAESPEVDAEDAGGEQVDHCGKKSKNFVKRNIELVSGGEGQVLLTQPEKERLAKLLREIEEEEEEGARAEESEETPVLTGGGYTPEASVLEQLIDIEFKLRLLCPDRAFQSVRSSYTNFSASGGCGTAVAWVNDGETQPGGKTLQYLKERREDERRLDEVQQQLELLGQNQEMTDESPRLTEEQLLILLDEEPESSGTTPSGFY